MAGRYGWVNPPDDQFSAAAAKDPISAAAVQASNQQSNRRGTSQLGQFPGQSSTSGRGISSTPVNMANYNNTGTNNSSAWYGQGNEYGAGAMADSSDVFWSGYGDQVMGNQPGGNATSFYANKYNTQALGNALYGRNFISDEEKLAGQSSIADAISAPGVQFFDPGQLVGNVMQALQTNDPDALGKVNPILAGLLQSVQGDPAGQVGTILGFLRELLSATMPAETLQAVLGQLASLGQVFTQGLLKGDMKNVDTANFATFLTQRLGPTLGL